MITKEITIEDLVTILPDSVTYLMEKGIRVLICGEPVWGTLEELVLAKGYSNEQLENFVSDLNKMLAEKTKTMAQ
ncbi:MAG: DUF1858 domain-containing protein [Candidatus Kapaibacteriota bacterium]|jgi:methionine synthase II (cobalamin-independent)